MVDNNTTLYHNDTSHQCGMHHSQCSLTADPGYIVYSALGSFYIPMCIMTFFYWKIYVAAARTTKAIKRGTIIMHTGSEINSSGNHNMSIIRVYAN